MPIVAFATPLNVILKAKFIEPTKCYDHTILGMISNWSVMRVMFDVCADCETCQIMTRIIRLPETRLFEDIAPRIVKDEFGQTAVMVVETDIGLGARLSIYSADRFYHATPLSVVRTTGWRRQGRLILTTGARGSLKLHM